MNEPKTPQESIWHETLSAEQRQVLGEARAEDLLARPDLLIVGGGIVGLALAYYLAGQGARVQLVDAGALAGEATAAGAGGIWPNDQGPLHPPGFRDLALKSRDLWGRLSLAPGFKFDWRVRGFLNVNPNRFNGSATGFAARAQEAGYTVCAVDAAHVALLEPALATTAAEAVHCPSDAHVNPLKAAASFAAEARRGGACLAACTRLEAFEVSAGRIVRAATNRGAVAPGAVVLATGWRGVAWNSLRLPAPPLRPVCGQLIATGPLPPVLNGAVAGEYLVLQLASGQVITGGNLVESADTRVDPAASARFAAAARQLLPALDGVPFVRAWCGARSATPDGLPIIDRLPGLENAWVAAGHYRNGLLLAPATGKFLADWIRTGERPGILAPFAYDRFRGTSGASG